MYLRRCWRRKDGKRHAYWALVESQRTERGPRQRVVAWLGALEEDARAAVQQSVEPWHGGQRDLFAEAEPEWIQVDVRGVRVERSRKFGGVWLGRELLRRLELDRFFQATLEKSRASVPWAVMAQVLVLGRLCEPSSELALAERFYESSALDVLLGVPAERVNDDRLYRALDALLPHKAALEKHLKEKLGELFALDYELLLYDVTSTYFEGQAAQNALAQRGYSRDHRGDCKQVNIALVVSRCGMPLGYEVFAGNRSDATTVEEIVTHIEVLYGAASRIWVMDRGMVSADNVAFLGQNGRRYIIGTAKNSLRKFERELAAGDWRQVRAGLEVQMVPSPDGREVFILCRSAERQAKEQAIHERFEQRIAAGLAKIAAACQRQRQAPGVIERRVGKLLGQNTRAAALFTVRVDSDASGAAQLHWTRQEAWRDWARLSEGCYLLRSNVTDWTPEELWRSYIQLTEAEAAFRIQKSDLQLRPVWHQRQDRVEAHILVCFLAYVLWKSLAAHCRQAGLGDEPRQVFADLAELMLVDIVLPTKQGIDIRKRCVSQPTEHQAILLHQLGFALPAKTELVPM